MNHNDEAPSESPDSDVTELSSPAEVMELFSISDEELFSAARAAGIVLGPNWDLYFLTVEDVGRLALIALNARKEYDSF